MAASTLERILSLSISAVVGIVTGLPTDAAGLASIARGGVLSSAGLPVPPRSRQSAIENSGRILMPNCVFIGRLSSVISGKTAAPRSARIQDTRSTSRSHAILAPIVPLAKVNNDASEVSSR